MLTLHYFPTSHWSRIIALNLAEAGLEFERVLVDITKAGSFDPDYMRLNPRGVVPTLVDGDEVICDGRHISKYIDKVSGTNLWRGDDEATQALIVELHDFPVMLFSYSVWVLAKQGERSKSILDDKVDRARRLADEHPDLREQYLRKAEFFEEFRAQVYDDDQVAACEARYREVLEDLGHRLHLHDWIAGDSYTFADCIATSILYRLKDLGKLDDWHGDDSNGLFAYYERLRARPSFRAVFYDDPLIAPHNRPTEPLPGDE